MRLVNVFIYFDQGQELFFQAAMGQGSALKNKLKIPSLRADFGSADSGV